MTALDPRRAALRASPPSSPRRRSSSAACIHTLRTPDVAGHGDRAADHPDADVHVRLRRRDRRDGGYVELRRAGHHPALRRIRRRQHGRRRRERHDDRHHRPVPHDADARRRRCITGHVVASLLRNLVATGDRDRGRRSRSASGRTPTLARVAGRARARSRCTSSRSPTCSRRSAWRRRARRRRRGYGFILLFLPYISSAFVPLDTMPDWLRWVAENQPLTPIIETIRSLLIGTRARATAAGWRSAGAW